MIFILGRSFEEQLGSATDGLSAGILKMDVVNTTTRSRMMAAVRSKDTAPELDIRRCLFRLGFRYRLHSGRLPGKPDMVFPKYRAAVFVNGCFWHNHNCSFGRLPATRRLWWKRKLEGNRKRDANVLSSLHRAGWRTLVVWECSVRAARGPRSAALDAVAGKTARFLRSNRPSAVFAGPRGRKVGERRSGG